MQQYSDCLKWKLHLSTDYILTENKTLIYLPLNTTYAIGEYRTSKNTALVCIPEDVRPPFYDVDLLYVTGWSLSIIALTLSVYIHCTSRCTSAIYDSRPLLCHMICLLGYYLCDLVFQVGPDYSKPACYFLGTFGQYAFLAAFCWLNVVTFNMWRHFHPQRILQSTSRPSCFKYTCQSLYAWMVPALIIVVSNFLVYVKAPVAIGYHARCLVDMYDNDAQVFFLHGSECCPLMVNVILVIITCVNLRSMSSGIAMANQRIHSQMLRMYIKLVLVTGVCWVIEVVEWTTIPYKPRPDYWIAPDFLNSLQGFILFLIYNCNSEVKSRLRQYFSNISSRLRSGSARSQNSASTRF